MKTIKPKVWKRFLAEKDWGEKFNLLLDQNNYDKHMTEKEVKDLLKKHKIKWTEFYKWMCGQTCPIIDGKMGYYRHDVERFISHKVKGIKLIWD